METTYLVQEKEIHPEVTLSVYAAGGENGLVVPKRVFHAHGLAHPGTAMQSMVWTLLTGEEAPSAPADIADLEVASKPEMLGRVAKFILNHVPVGAPEVEEDLFDEIKARMEEDNPELKEALNAMGLVHARSTDDIDLSGPYL